MARLSVLDLSPILEGDTIRGALDASLTLAQHTEALGFHRFWVAEHHNMAGIASAATAVLISYIAGGTQSIRVGAGGVMLPNHAPLVIAEQFGTLEALFPGRIDLGLGRAPGTDGLTMRALRRNLQTESDQFPKDVVELKRYLSDPAEEQKVRAVPGQSTHVPLYILGSSLFGAHLAAVLGLPFAFASHFAPQDMMQAIAIYRENFEPSDQLDAPYVMLGYNICAADSQQEAEYLRTSGLKALLHLRTGNPIRLPPPDKHFTETLSDQARTALSQFSSAAAVGDKDEIRRKVADFLATTKADELIITGQIYDLKARLKSYEITYQACHNL